MTTTHETVYWTAGDDWEINATLLDENGNPFNLTGATIKWALMNSAFQKVLDETDVTITVLNPVLGTCKIVIPAGLTDSLPPARYSDMLRIVSGGITSTLAYGLIYVAANPWIPAILGSAQRTLGPVQLHAVG